MILREYPKRWAIVSIWIEETGAFQKHFADLKLQATFPMKIPVEIILVIKSHRLR